MRTTMGAAAAVLFLILGTAHAQQQLQLWGSGTDIGCCMGTTWELVNLLTARAKPVIDMGYRLVNFTTALVEFTGGSSADPTTASNFMVSDRPLPSSTWSQLSSAGGVVQVPIAFTRVAVYQSTGAFVVPDHQMWQPVPPVPLVLNISACTLANIFSGAVTSWGDNSILQDNPALQANATLLATFTSRPIHVYVPSSWGDSWTASFSAYLHKACPASWPSTSMPVSWGNGVMTYNGPASLAAAMASGSNSIAFAESTWGNSLGLVEVAIKTFAGSFMMSVNASQTLLATALVSGYPSVTADWSNYQPINSNMDPGAWPMPIINFLFMHKTNTALGNSTGLLPALATLMLSDEVQAKVMQYDACALSSYVLQDLRSQVANLNLDQGVPKWSFENLGQEMPGAGQADYVISAMRTTYPTFLPMSQENTLDGVHSTLTTLEYEIDMGLNTLANNNNAAAQQIATLQAQVATLNNQINQLIINASAAAAVRTQLLQITSENAATAKRANHAVSVAVAGVVISVLLAVAAIILAGVWVSKTKVLDSKIQKYIPVGFSKGTSDVETVGLRTI